MKLHLLIWLPLALATNAFGHRLDEYLQATRIAVSTNRIDLSIDLTPGIAIANQLLAFIDTNGDGDVSENERSDYEQRFLKDFQLKLDEKVLASRLVEASFPTPFEIKNGVGVIRIKTTVSLKRLTAGKHTLSLTNAHLPAISVYLANALIPKDPAIQITKQSRDEFQKHYRLEFEVVASRR